MLHVIGKVTSCVYHALIVFDIAFSLSLRIFLVLCL